MLEECGTLPPPRLLSSPSHTTTSFAEISSTSAVIPCIRGSLLVLGSLTAAVLLSDFPHNRATPLLIFPVIFAILGIADTARCLQRRWSLYHAGVILLLYMDLMALSMIVFFFLYPYFHWLSPTH